MKVANIALRARLVAFTISLPPFVLPVVASAASSDYSSWRKSDGTPQSVMLSYYDGPDTRGFAWQTSTSVSLGALWLLMGEWDSTTGNFDTNQVATASSTKQTDCYTHKAHVTGLAAGTWSYRLGTASHYAYGQFEVRDGTRPFVAINITDIQLKSADKLSNWKNVVKGADAVLGGGKNADTIISCGDFFDSSYPSSTYAKSDFVRWGVTADQARDEFADVAWTMVSGNHDTSYCSKCCAENYNSAASSGGGCHSYDYGCVHVATIPYATSLSSGVESWLKADLAAAQDAQWRILVMHFGPYTTADHGQAAKADYVQKVAGLCATYKVDLVLQGHDHTYSKTLPYLWSGPGYTSSATDSNAINLSPATVDINGQTYYDNPEGTVYVSAGCAGDRVGENASIALSTYANRTPKIVCDKINVTSSYAKQGDNGSLSVNAPMFAVLTADDSTLKFDWYVAASATPVLFDTLRISKAPYEPPVDAPNLFSVSPYVQYPDTNAMSILFFTTENAKATVKVWPADGSVAAATVKTTTPTDVSSILGKNPKNSDTLTYTKQYKHAVRFTGLKLHADYCYSVTPEGGATYCNTFRTLPDKNTPVRFIGYCDCETTPNGSATKWSNNGGKSNYFVGLTEGFASNLVHIAARKPDLITISGDLAAQGGYQKNWDEFWRQNAGVNAKGDGYGDIAGSIPILAAIGNHDLKDGSSTVDATLGGEFALEKYLAYFEYNPNGVKYEYGDGTTTKETRDLSQLFHRTDLGPVTLIFLDTNKGAKGKNKDSTQDYADRPAMRAPDFHPGSLQYTWLTNNLADAQRNSKFTFVINHHCPYSVGQHNRPSDGGGYDGYNTGSGCDGESAQAVRCLTEAMIQYGVDGWLCGHDEIQEHSQLSGTEILPDGSTRNHTLNVYDLGSGGDGLRGDELVKNPYEVFRAFKDEPDKWQTINGTKTLISGGCHYGHMEVDVTTNRYGKWMCSLTPVYIFVSNDKSGTVKSFQRCCYQDRVIIDEESNEIVYQETKNKPVGTGVPADYVEYVRPPEGPGAAPLPDEPDDPGEVVDPPDDPPTNLSPATTEANPISLLAEKQRSYLYDQDHVSRDTNVKSAPSYSGGSAVTLSWSGASGTVTVSVKRLSDSKVIHTETTSGSSLLICNLEIGAGYEWTVTDSSGASASATFHTSPDAPRLIKAGSMEVLRDLGGWTGLNGCKVRQNELLRGGPASGIDAAATTFFHDVLGLKTELDFRGESSDRLNVDGVAYVPLSRDEQYRVLTTTVNGRSGMSQEKWENLIKSFEYIFDKSKRPLYFHCSAGKDRTGITAALVLALLGVDIEDIWRDYQATPQSSPIIDKDSYFQGYLHDMATVMSGYDTFQKQVEAYFIEKLGFTRGQIETFREEMLIGYVAPEDPAVTSDSFAITPYLQRPATDAMSILFFTKAASVATVTCRRHDGVGPTFTEKTTGVWAQALTNNVYHFNQNDKVEKNKWNNSLHKHRVRFEGLASNRIYDYTVTLPGGETYSNTFRTAPDRDTPIRFVSYADCETTDGHFANYTANLKKMQSRNPDLITTGGDLTARGGIQSHWDEFWMQNAGKIHSSGSTEYTDILGSIPMITPIGNHDLFDNAEKTVSSGWFHDRQGEVATEKFLSYFEFNPNGVHYTYRDGTNIPETRDMSQLFHREDYGPVTLIFLDTNNGQDGDTDADHDRDTNYDKPGDSKHTEGGMDRRKGARHPDFNPGTLQYTWLTNQLADAQEKSRFTFVFNHHCPYSIGGHNQSWTTGEDASALAVRVLTETMVRYGVDGWYCGHDELLEHSITNGYEILPNGQRRKHTLSIYDLGCSGDEPRSSSGAANPLAYWKGSSNYGGTGSYGFLETDVTTNKLGQWTCTITPVQGSTGNYVSGSQIVYVENPNRGENENDLVYSYASNSGNKIDGATTGSTKPASLYWLAWEKPPEGSAWDESVEVSLTEVTAADLTYNGAEQTPQLTVKAGELTVPSDHYAVSPSSVKNVGDYTVTVTGTGNVKGAKQVSFKVIPAPATVRAKDLEMVVGGSEPVLDATVSGTFGADTLNYTLSRESGDAIGTYAITVTGEAIQGNYDVTFVPGTLTIHAEEERYQTSYTLAEGETTGVLWCEYVKSGSSDPQDRWWKFDGGDASIAAPVFVEANPNEPKMSGTHTTRVRFRFVGRKAGTTTWKAYTYTDKGQQEAGTCPGYTKANPAQNGKTYDSNDWSTSSGISITVTVTEKPQEPVETEFEGQVIKTFGATVDTTTAPGELILVYDNPACVGTLELPTNAVADILVVGGGGGAGGGYTSSGGSAYWGDAGNAGEVRELLAQVLGAGNEARDITIKVGAGGKGGKGGSSSVTNGQDGEDSSIGEWTAAGGAGGKSRKTSSYSEKSTSLAGTGTGTRSTITGETYGTGGAAATSGGAATPVAALPNTGNGGDAPVNPSENSTASTGADGGSGIVIVRITGFAKPEPPSFSVTPYLQRPAPTEMTVRFFTSQPCAATVTCGGRTFDASCEEATELVKVASDDQTIWGTQYRHDVRLTGLSPNTAYEYEVALDEGETYRNTLHTAPADIDTPVRFVAYSDSETVPPDYVDITPKKNNHATDDGRTQQWDRKDIGDDQTYHVSRSVGFASNLLHMASWKPDFYVIAGDIAARGGVQLFWDEFWKENAGGLGRGYGDPAGAAPVLAVMGNHDHYDNKGVAALEYNTSSDEIGLKKYLTYFTFDPNGVDYASSSTERDSRDKSQLFHRLDYGPVTVLFLDTNKGGSAPSGSRAPSFDKGSLQYQWVEENLKDARDNRHSRFIFVVSHQDPYSCGKHNKSSDGQSTANVRAQLTDLMLQYGVTGWFAGHDEMQEHAQVTGSGHTMHVYDLGSAGDGLKGVREYPDNAKYITYAAYFDSPDGTHYGHLQVEVAPSNGVWYCTMTPAYSYFASPTSPSEYRQYEDKIVIAEGGKIVYEQRAVPDEESVTLRIGETVTRLMNYDSACYWVLGGSGANATLEHLDVSANGSPKVTSAYTDYSLRTSSEISTLNVTLTGRSVGTETVVLGREYTPDNPKTVRILHVTVLPLELTAATAANQTYTGKVLSPSVTVKAGTRTLSASDYEIVNWSGDRINAGTYTATVRGKGDFGGEVSLSFTIDPKPVTVEANPLSKEYGTEDPELTATVKGLVDGESAEELIDYDISREHGENYGTYVITPSGDAVQGNYAVTYRTALFTITKAQAKPRGAVTASLEYGTQLGDAKIVGTMEDRRTHTEVKGVFTFGEPDRILSVSDSGVQCAATFIPDREFEDNYDPSQLSVAVTVRKRPLTVKAIAQSIAYGSERTSFGYLLTGFVLGQSQSTVPIVPITGEPTFACDYEPGKPIGEYDIAIESVANLSAANYSFVADSTTVKLTVVRKEVTVTADDKEKNYGEDDPELTATVTGMVNGESAAELIKYEISREKGADVGDYTITPSGEVAQGNYQVSYRTGTLRIGKTQPRVKDGETLTATLVYGQALGAAQVSDVMVDHKKRKVAGSFDFGANENRILGVKESGEYAATFVPDDSTNYTTASVTVRVTVNPVELTVSAAASSVTYGEEATVFKCQYSGFVAGENASTVKIDGQPIYSCTYTKGDPVSGSYTVSVTGIGTLVADNYTFRAASTPATLTVTPRPVTVTSENATKTYGEKDPPFSVKLGNVLSGEENQIEYGFTRVEGEDVKSGGYRITPMGEDDQGNYSVTFVPEGVLTINPAKITSATAPDIEYQNATISPVLTVMAGELTVPSEAYSVGTWTWSKTAQSAGSGKTALKTIGKHTATVTARAGGNFTGSATVSFEIVKANYDMSGVTFADQTVTYNGNARSLAISGTLPTKGVTTSAKLSNPVYTGNGRTAVGEYEVSVTFTNGDANHYNTPTLKAKLTIVPATIMSASAADATYTGEALSPAVTVTANSLTLSATDYTITNWSGDRINAGEYRATVTGKGNFEGEKLLVFTVVPAKITNVSVLGATYTGSVLAPALEVKAGTIVLEADDYELGTWSPSAPKDVGTYTATVTGKGNFTGGGTATFVVSRQTIDLKGVVFADDTVTYDTAAHSILALNVPDGVLVTYEGNGKTDASTYVVKAKFAAEDPKNYAVSTAEKSATLTIKPAPITSADIPHQTYTGKRLEPKLTVKAGELTLSATDYSLSSWQGDLTSAGTNTATVSGIGNFSGTTNVIFVVDKAPLTVTAENQGVGAGEQPPQPAFVSTGFVNGEDESVFKGELQATYSPAYTTTAAAGATFEIVPSGVTADNYAITFVSGVLEVGKSTPKRKSLTATGLVYGQAFGDSELTGEAYVGDEENVIDGKFTWENAAAHPAVRDGGVIGSVLFTPSDLDNYMPVHFNVAVQVSPAKLTVSVADTNIVYGSAAPLYACSITGFVNDETDSVVVGARKLDCAYHPGDDAGTYGIKADATTFAADNYTFEFLDGELTVRKRTLTVSAKDRAITYGDPVLEYSYGFSGFFGDDNEDLVKGKPTLACAYTQGTKAGSYEISVSDVSCLSSDNYDFEPSDKLATLTVRKRNATVAAKSYTKEYGEADPAFEATVTGLYGEDTLSYTVVREDAGNEVVGKHTIVADGAAETDNYLISYTPGTLTIGAAQLTTDGLTATITYGETLGDTASRIVGKVKTKLSAQSADVSGVFSFPGEAGERPTVEDGKTKTYFVTFTPDDKTVYKTCTLPLTIVVNKKELTVKAAARTITYGETVPDDLTYAITGFIDGDDESAVFGFAVCSCAYKQYDDGIGDYPIAVGVSALAADNYVFAAADPKGLLTVGPAPARIVAQGDATKVYNAGAGDPDFTATMEGTFNGDKLTNGFTRVAGENVGTYVLTPTGDAVQGNYKVTFVDGLLTITPAEIDSAYANEQEYDGNVKTPKVKVLAGTLTATYELDGTWDGDLIDAGTYWANVKGTGNFTGKSRVRFVITKATCSMYGVSLQGASATYDGQPHSLSVSGTVPDGLTVTYENNGQTNAGEYEVSAVFTPDENHEEPVPSRISAVLTVKQATITQAVVEPLVYNGEEQVPTVKVWSGTLEATFDLGKWSAAPKNIGRYTTMVTGTGNFTGSLEAVCEMKPATVTIAADRKTMEYGTPKAEEPKLTAAVTGIVAADQGKVTIDYKLSRESGDDIGIYEISATYAAAQGNYAVEFVPANFEITVATPLVDVVPTAIITYGKTLSSATIVGAMKNRKGESVAGTFAVGDALAEKKPAVVESGKYPAVFMPKDTGHYGDVEVEVEVEVRPATLTVIPEDKTAVYGDDPPDYTWHYEGFVNGDTAAAVTVDDCATNNLWCTYAKFSPVADYDIAVVATNGLTAANYVFVPCADPATLTITPASPEKTAIVDAFRGLGTWQGNEQDGWKVTLMSDVGETLVLNGNLGRLVLDLNGHTVTGTPGADEDVAAGTPAGDGQPAIRVLPADETAAVAPTDLSVVNSDPEGHGGLVGGKGGAGNPPGRDGRTIDVPLAEDTVGFANEALTGREGESIFVCVKCGKRTKSASVQLNAVYETAAASDLDLKSVKVNGVVDSSFKFPCTLTWGPGLPDEQVIEIPIKVDTTAEANETLVLELQNPINVELDWNLCEVTIKEDQKTVTGVYVRAVPNDATRGKVTGSALVIPGKKVTVKATAQKGFVFTGWFEGEELKEKAASYALEPTNSVDLVACFEPLAADYLELTDDFLPSELKLGEVFSNAVTVASGSLPTITVSGLPAGLKFYSKETKVKLNKNTSVLVPANTIYGIPTKASATNKTSGVVTPSKVKVTVKNLGGYKIVRTYALVVSEAGTESGGFAPVISEDKPYAVVSVELSDDAAGKVTGAGLYQAGKKVTVKATANKGYVFAAWIDKNGVTNSTAASYVINPMPSNDVSLVAKFVLPDEIADPSDPTGKKNTHGVAVVRNNDFAGNITGAGYYAAGKKVTLKATALKGYVFAGWATEDFTVTNQAASLTFTMGTEKVRAYAVFVTAGEDLVSVATAANGMGLFATEKDVPCISTNVMCGVDLRWPVVSTALSLPKVAVSGLPSGLKFTAKDIMKKGSKTEVDIPANTIYGAPTAASSVDRATGLPKPSKVKVTVTTSGKSKAEYQIDLVVNPLPDYAVGTFDGYVVVDGDVTNGVVKLTVAKNGKISGTIQTNCLGAAAKKLTLSAASFADYDLVTGVFTLVPTYKNGKVTVEVPLALFGGAEVEVEEGVTNVVGVIESVGGVVPNAPFELCAWQNVLKGAAANAFIAPDLSAMYSELTLSVQKDGVLKVAGKVNGVTASGSSQIYYDADEHGYRAVIYLLSKKDFDGVAEVIEVNEANHHN